MHTVVQLYMYMQARMDINRKQSEAEQLLNHDEQTNTWKILSQTVIKYNYNREDATSAIQSCGCSEQWTFIIVLVRSTLNHQKSPEKESGWSDLTTILNWQTGLPVMVRAAITCGR